MRILLVMLLVGMGSPPAWAKTIKIMKGTVAVNQLHDELLEQFPAWRGTPQPDGTFTDPLLRVEFTDEEITLMIPDEGDEAAVRRVVASHVPGRRANKAGGRVRASQPRTLEERLQHLEAALGVQE